MRSTRSCHQFGSWGLGCSALTAHCQEARPEHVLQVHWWQWHTVLCEEECLLLSWRAKRGHLHKWRFVLTFYLFSWFFLTIGSIKYVWFILPFWPNKSFCFIWAFLCLGVKCLDHGEGRVGNQSWGWCSLIYFAEGGGRGCILWPLLTAVQPQEEWEERG